MLEPGADVLVCREGLHNVLRHTSRMFGPERKVFRIERKILLEILYDLLVFEGQNRTDAGRKAVDFRHRVVQRIRRDEGADLVLRDIPELLTFVSEEDDCARALRIERGRRIADPIADQRVNCVFVECDITAERILRTALFFRSSSMLFPLSGWFVMIRRYLGC